MNPPRVQADYDNDSLIETRNGSSLVVKHHAWGTRYIDELVQVTSVADSGFSTSYTRYRAP